jgi:kynurenine formamidase
MSDIFDHFRNARVFDLGQPMYPGIPHFPTHPPFLFTLNKLHGEFVNPGGGSSASDTITLGGHVGTHIDALNHFSCAGKLFGGMEPRQTSATGVTPHSVDSIEPVLRRGVLFDVAGAEQVDTLPENFAITPEHLDAIAAKNNLRVGEGDVVLIRTGWARHWDDPHRFVTANTGAAVTGPGPEKPAAEWLSKRGIFAAGSDTLAFERVPSAAMPVHVHLLVESGIHIIENLNLERLAAERVCEFLFIAAPLKIRGGTGSPIRPIAVAPR